MNPSPEQQKIISTIDRELLVIAGPGSGKTRTLVWRIEHMVKADGIDPKNIVAITFTNAAAGELASRLEHSCGFRIGFVGTLHSFCLRYMILLPPFHTGFSVMNEHEEADLIKSVCNSMKFDGTESEIREALAMGPPAAKSMPSRLELVCKEIWKTMIRDGTLSFDGILAYFHHLLVKSDKLAFAGYHFLIDEVQDSNPIDLKIYDALPGTKMLVGDTDQSMYSFRGAAPEVILAKARDGVPVLRLEDNYRCPSVICSAANRLIGNNSDRIEKLTVSVKDDQATITLNKFDTHTAEAVWVNELCQKMFALGESCAVLVRTNALVNHFRMSIPHGILVEDPKKNDNCPGFYAMVALLNYLDRPWKNSVAAKACSYFAPEASASIARAAAQDACTINEVWKNEHQHVLHEIPGAMLRYGITPEARQLAMEAIERLPLGASISDLLLSLHHRSEEPVSVSAAGLVTISTIHRAKGLEWDHVILPAFEQEVIPAKRALEEERRIAYVAVTRAKKSLHISHAASRQSPFGFRQIQQHSPSQFIEEMQLQLSNA